MPFTREEMVGVLAASNQYKDNYGRTGQNNARRLRAFVLVLRYSSLRIRDAVTPPKRERLFFVRSPNGGRGSHSLSHRQRIVFLLEWRIETQECGGRLATEFAQVVRFGWIR